MANDNTILERAAQLIEQVGVGVLTTVDPQQRPHSRWMAAVAEPGLLRIFCLSAKETRKVEQIRQNRAVCWSFTSADFRDIVTLKGTATLHSTTDVPMSVWNQLIESTERYSADAARDEGHFAYTVIVTRVSTLEFISPSSGLYTPHFVDFDASQT